jgi:hypothetical protein
MGNKMTQLRELRTYISAIAALPIMLMLLNEAVFRVFLSFARSPYFLFAVVMMLLYTFLWAKGHFSRIKNSNLQLLAKTAIVNLPVVPPLVAVMLTRDLANFLSVFFAYLFFGVLACVYQIVAGGRVGALQRISFFFIGYVLALIAYSGSLVGLQTGQFFSLSHAFDHISVLASLFGYLVRITPLPLANYVRIAMMFAIPAITFSALAAQVRQTEVKDSPTGEPKLVSSLRPAVALLTVVSVLFMFPVLFASRLLAESNPFLVTLLPPLAAAALSLLIVRITE